MRQVVVCIVALVLASGGASSQTPGTCWFPEGEAMLDVGNVRARITNNGHLFWRGTPPAIYEVPKGGGVSAVFTAGLWVGGLVHDTLRIAAARYGSYEFSAGPLDAFGNPPYDCNIYDRLFVLSMDDIKRFAPLQMVFSETVW